ncbi:type II secretion system F family protein [Lachnospiraceae bacterium 62-35]
MINWFQIIMMALATPFTILWLVLLKKYSHTFDSYIAGLSPEEYHMPELFFIGMGFIHLSHYDLHSEKARKRIKEIAEIKGKKYAEYYFYIAKSASFTYLLTLIPFVLIFAAFSNEPGVALLGVALSVLLVKYLDEQMNDKLEERREELILDLPQMLSKMALLINSGMVMREAWNKVAETGDRALYQEMRITTQEMMNGASELDAYRNFAERCSVKEIRKMTSTLIQNMQKGNKEITYFLSEMSAELWEEKKNLVKQKGETAGTKLLLPIGMIFIGILILIIVPIFMNGF